MALASIDALFILCFPLKGIYFLGFFFFLVFLFPFFLVGLRANALWLKTAGK